MMLPRFTADDLDGAHESWGANCGPGALAAMTGLTLEEVRPHLGEFEQKGYTNPTLMYDTLRRLGIRWRQRKPVGWPDYGLCRVQWEGPWTQPGVPVRARYRQTHWIGAMIAADGRVGIFDINAMGNGTGWCSLENWRSVLIPYILKECVPRASGAWHLTHAVEIDRASLERTRWLHAAPELARAHP